MGRTTALRGEIKRRFLPHLVGRGFVPDMRHAPQFYTLRKIAPEAVHVCDIQWDKYGRQRFAVNFGTCAADGVTYWGKRIMPTDVFPVHTSHWGRLLRKPYGIGKDWFRQDRPIIGRIVSFKKLYLAEDVVSELMAVFPEVEDFWASGQTGRHLHLLPSLNRKAAE